jgi:hypothetical protein
LHEEPPIQEQRAPHHSAQQHLKVNTSSRYDQQPQPQQVPSGAHSAHHEQLLKAAAVAAKVAVKSNNPWLKGGLSIVQQGMKIHAAQQSPQQSPAQSPLDKLLLQQPIGSDTSPHPFERAMNSARNGYREEGATDSNGYREEGATDSIDEDPSTEYTAEFNRDERPLGFSFQDMGTAEKTESTNESGTWVMVTEVGGIECCM